MQRQILFLAHQLEGTRPVRRDERSLETRDHSFERYEDVRLALDKFGQVMREKTSGTFRRFSTPPEGMPRVEQTVRHRILAGDPQDLASSVEVTAQEQRNVIQVREAFLKAIRGCDAVVAMEEFESDTRGALIEYAVATHKPVLLLRRETNLVPPVHPMYLHRAGITCSAYRGGKELLYCLSHFFQHIRPRTQFNAGG